jgi:nitrite reductase/ring-hydroxylating ferredoxin subunit
MAKHFVVKATAITPGHSRTFFIAGKKIFIANVDGVMKGYVNFCPHMGGSLHYDGRQFKCNWHGATFDPQSGEPKTLPALGTGTLQPLIIEVDGDDIYYVEEEVKKSAWADDF